MNIPQRPPTMPSHKTCLRQPTHTFSVSTDYSRTVHNSGSVAASTTSVDEPMPSGSPEKPTTQPNRYPQIMAVYSKSPSPPFVMSITVTLGVSTCNIYAHTTIAAAPQNQNQSHPPPPPIPTITSLYPPGVCSFGHPL